MPRITPNYRTIIGELDRDPSTVNDSVAVHTPGNLYLWGGDLYVYAIAEDTPGWVDGSVCAWANTTMTEASADRSGGTAIVGTFAGVALRTVADGAYGFLLVKGYHDAVKVEAGVAAGDALCVSTTDHTATAIEDVFTTAYTSAGTLEAAYTAASGIARIGSALAAASSAGTAACCIGF